MGGCYHRCINAHIPTRKDTKNIDSAGFPYKHFVGGLNVGSMNEVNEPSGERLATTQCSISIDWGRCAQLQLIVEIKIGN